MLDDLACPDQTGVVGRDPGGPQGRIAQDRGIEAGWRIRTATPSAIGQLLVAQVPHHVGVQRPILPAEAMPEQQEQGGVGRIEFALGFPLPVHLLAGAQGLHGGCDGGVQRQHGSGDVK